MFITKLSQNHIWVVTLVLLVLITVMFFACDDPVEGPILKEDENPGDDSDPKDTDSPTGKLFWPQQLHGQQYYVYA